MSTTRAARTDNMVLIIRERKGKTEWAKALPNDEAWDLFKSLAKLFEKGKPK